jgi:NAD(P)-dependent dehydrogenase (short-subunit alcohol dehydrogenase family)
VDELRFDGKVAIVTGAGRGLGSEYVRLLAGRGCRVVVNDAGVAVSGESTDEHPADAVVQAIRAAGGEAVADTHDVVDEADEIVATALDAFGRLDILVNNAGITNAAPFAKLPKAQFERLFDTHFMGTVNVARAAWPHLLGAGRARIVNTSSPAIFGGRYIAPYASAKAATVSFTKVLAEEGARKGVNVNAVAPGASTRMTSFVPGALGTYVRQFLPAADVAAFVVWLAHESTRVTGETFSVGGGVARRIVLAVSRGVKVDEPVPEAWVGRDEQLLGFDGLDMPADLVDDMRFHAERLGAAALSVFEQATGQQS